MPEPLPIPQEVINGIEDVIDKSRLAGFDHGHEVGYKEGFNAAIKAIEGQLAVISIPRKTFVDDVRKDLGLKEEPTPIVEEMGWVIQQPANIIHKKRVVAVKALGLSTKTQNALTNAGVTKVKQLTDMSTAELRKVPRIGAGSVKEIIAVLKKHGRSLRA